MDIAHVARLSLRLLNRINQNLQHVIRNGDSKNSYPGILAL